MQACSNKPPELQQQGQRCETRTAVTSIPIEEFLVIRMLEPSGEDSVNPNAVRLPLECFRY